MIIVNLVTGIINFLFSPQLMNLKLFFDTANKKLYYSIKMWNFFPINSGYVTVNKKYIFLHYSKKRAVAFSIKEFFENKPDLESIGVGEIIKISIYNKIGVENNVNKLYVALILENFKNALKILIENKKPFIEYKNNLIVDLSNGKDVFYVELTIAFNFFTAIYTIIKNVLEGMIANYGKKQRVAQ